MALRTIHFRSFPLKLDAQHQSALVRRIGSCRLQGEKTKGKTQRQTIGTQKSGRQKT